MRGCGDGIARGTESCDGDDLKGATCSSVSAQFGGGNLGCRSNCAFDLSQCQVKCGPNNMLCAVGDTCVECKGATFHCTPRGIERCCFDFDVTDWQHAVTMCSNSLCCARDGACVETTSSECYLR